MERESFKTRSGETLFRPILSDEELSDIGFDWNLDDPGFCRACGIEVMGVEPDARKYECESCGERQVYGLQELLIMGEIS